MKALLQPGKSFGSAASSATAQRKGGLKTIVDNRPTAIAQRKLQGVAQAKGAVRSKPVLCNSMLGLIAPIQGKFYLKSDINKSLTINDFKANIDGTSNANGLSYLDSLFKYLIESNHSKIKDKLDAELYLQDMLSDSGKGYGIYEDMPRAVWGIHKLMTSKRTEDKVSFNPTDKAYGLHDEREAWLANNCQIDESCKKENTEIFTTIDQLNNLLKLRISEKPDIKSLSGEAKEFGEALINNAKYTPETVPFKSSDYVNKRIKKACKAGIQYTTNVKNSKIHFELENIDMVQVVKREKRKGSADITGSELRSIYREFKRNVGKINLDNILFYHKGSPVKAPWKADSELWSKYDGLNRKGKSSQSEEEIKVKQEPIPKNPTVSSIRPTGGKVHQKGNYDRIRGDKPKGN